MGKHSMVHIWHKKYLAERHYNSTHRTANRRRLIDQAQWLVDQGWDIEVDNLDYVILRYNDDLIRLDSSGMRINNTTHAMKEVYQRIKEKETEPKREREPEVTPQDVRGK